MPNPRARASITLRSATRATVSDQAPHVPGMTLIRVIERPKRNIKRHTRKNDTHQAPHAQQVTHIKRHTRNK
eukprot:650380-Amphidinium_carterae.1